MQLQVRIRIQMQGKRGLQVAVREVAGSEDWGSECAKLKQAKAFNDDLLGLG